MFVGKNPWQSHGFPQARRILKAGGRLGMGGDYGFAWNPHGEYAKELSFFVHHVGFSPAETLRCATKTGAGVVISRDQAFSVMLNEEDHLRMQALRPGLQSVFDGGEGGIRIRSLPFLILQGKFGLSETACVSVLCHG